jgi:competence protein ComEC
MAHRPPFGLLASHLARPAAWPQLRWPRAADRWALARWLHGQLMEERERWLLWLPVCLGIGIGLYFALPAEPPAGLAPALLLPLLLLAGARWRRGDAGPALALLVGAAAVLAGAVLAQQRTRAVEAPVLERRGAYWLEGTVQAAEARVRGDRLLLGDLVIDDLAPTATPHLVRASRRSAEPPLAVGDRIRLRAMLMPPSPPSEPHGFDFARQAWFERLGAVGYGLGPVELRARAAPTGWALALARLRQQTAAAISAAIPGEAGAVAVALTIGFRGAVSDQTWQDMQIAGTAHILSISGLHLSLVAGTLFFACRIALVLIPPLALRLPTKKIAALIALLGAVGYLLLSGAPVPTQRACVMTGLMLLAVMADRNPFSMRLAAVAALAVLASQPESLLGASFQMSFAAVIALIAAYEAGAGRLTGGAGGLGWQLALYVGGIALTTVIASAANAPLGIFHFGRLPTFGTVANLVAVPLTALWIMPAGLIGMLLLPLGLHELPLVVMGWGIELMLAVCSAVAAWPAAAVGVARPPLAALITTVLGGLWLCLWTRPWRRLGLFGIALGLVLTLLARPPDVLVDRSGQIVAVRTDAGLALSPWQRDSWQTDGWLRGAGLDEAAPWPAAGSPGLPELRCDGLGCVISRHGRQVALARLPEALEEDCAAVDLVVSYPRLEACPTGTPLLGPAALARAGGVALWLEPRGVRVLGVAEARGDRPWVR